MTIHSIDRQRLQKFVGRFLKGGVKRAEVLRNVVRLLSRFNANQLPSLLPRFEAAFDKAFKIFRDSKTTTLKVRVKKALTYLSHEFEDLSPIEKNIIISISAYLLMSTIANGVSSIATKVSKAA